jgi:1,4-alpha-glucan branching enzyme
VAAFGRDPESSRSVWSSKSGYPGDPIYREFYRDLGYDGNYEYVKNFLHPDGIRRNLGLKYHRITGKVHLHQKEPWVPTPAFKRAMEHGGNFAYNRTLQAEYLNDLLGRPPVVVSPYDAELFGHWWFEGPQFIESVFRTLDGAGRRIEAITGAAYLDKHPVNQVITPTASSWGDNGYNGVWLNTKNDWIYRHLHMAEERMREVAMTRHDASGLERRACNQMARELLLAQSSDWAFIMTTGTSPAYASRRTKDHINRFTGLYEMVVKGQLNEDAVRQIEWRDPIFEELDFRVYR